MTLNPTSQPGATLTTREREVLDRMCAGERPRELAWNMGVEMSTVKHYAHSARVKARAVTTYQLIAMYARGEVE